MATNNPVRRIAASASDLVVLNAETTGKVLLRQTEAFEGAVKATVEQLKTMVSAESFGDAVKAQQDYYRTLAENARAAGRDNWETIRSAGGQASDVVKATFRTKASDVADDAVEVASNAFNDARSEVQDFVAPESK